MNSKKNLQSYHVLSVNIQNCVTLSLAVTPLTTANMLEKLFCEDIFAINSKNLENEAALCMCVGEINKAKSRSVRQSERG